ncbi:MAG: hypothetical protein HYS13_12095 [Planctomycetia bacterium]|nr:hypothetical protein [Planctomycetia bacterium]
MAGRKKLKDVDEHVSRVVPALGAYKKARSRSEIDVHRHNSVSIRIRIIDADFQGLDLVERDNEIWKILDRLPDDVRSEVSLVLLLTPHEAKTSYANVEFEHPVPSNL